MLKVFCLIEIELVSMGAPTEWGRGQIAPVAPPPLSVALANVLALLINCCVWTCMTMLDVDVGHTAI